MNNVIEIHEINKIFNNKNVLSNINLLIEENKIYALLGRNGSGKSSLMKIITTRYLPDSGTVTVLNENAYENEKILSEIVYMSDSLAPFQFEKVKNILAYASSFYPRWNKILEDKLVITFKIEIDKKYSTLSKGQQSAISIIIGLCSRAKITMFDEIYSGLDAAYRQEFYKILINEYIEFPRTFIISTHLINEMEKLFTNVLILDKGELIINDDYDNVRNSCYLIKGPKNKINIIESKKIINSNFFANSFSATILDTISNDEMNFYQQNNLSVSSLSLQDIFISLTDEK